MQQDFKIPGRSGHDKVSQSSPQEPILPEPLVLPAASPSGPRFSKRASSKRTIIAVTVLAIAAIIMIGIVAVGGWYVTQLQPRDPGAGQRRVTIARGTPLLQLADNLESEGIIKSSTAFQVYIRVKGLQGDIQAGTYVFSPSQSVQDIVRSMVDGDVDTLNVTLPPGQTLREITDNLAGYGFSRESINQALKAEYSHPLLASKPADASLEGYIFPDTYKIDGNGSIESLLELSFDTFYEQLQEQNVLNKLSQRQMTLHQAITLASIVQEEVSDESDQRKVSQVFHRRLSENIPLQSDPTFIYPARQAGDQPSVRYDSPYNTYLHAGLPPGPIANFNFSAIAAVADPAPGDFLYFVADKNGVTHFAKTLREHEANVEKFCTEHCNDF